MTVIVRRSYLQLTLSKSGGWRGDGFRTLCSVTYRQKHWLFLRYTTKRARGGPVGLVSLELVEELRELVERDAGGRELGVVEVRELLAPALAPALALLVQELPPLVGERDEDDAAVLLGAAPRDHPVALESVEHPGDRRGRHLRLAGELT